MLSPAQISYLKTAFAAATEAQHKWPAAAAAESAQETGWGVHMPPDSNNVLGIKAYKGWAGKKVSADGTEQNTNGTWTGPQADLWCAFACMADCFREQVRILQEPRYALAMSATTIEGYIVEECKVWSTGILKGQSVLAIYHAHKDLFGG